MKKKGSKFMLLYGAPRVNPGDGEDAEKDYPNNYREDPDTGTAREMEDVYAGPDFFGPDGSGGPGDEAEEDYPFNNAEQDEPPMAPVYAGPDAFGADELPRVPEQTERPRRGRKLFMGRVYAGPDPEGRDDGNADRRKQRRKRSLFGRKSMECVYAGPDMWGDGRKDGPEPAEPEGSGSTEQKAPEGERKSSGMPRMEAVYACPPPKKRQEDEARLMEGVYAGPGQLPQGPRDQSMMLVYAGPQTFSGMQGAQLFIAVEGEIPKQEQPAERYQRCPVCGKERAEDDRFCSECGTPLNKKEEAPQAGSGSGGENRTVGRRCRLCGTELPENATFCPECGTPAERKESKMFVSVYAAPPVRGGKLGGKPGKPDGPNRRENK